MSFGNLTPVVLQHIALAAVENSHRAALDRSGVLAGRDSVSGRFYAEHFDTPVTYKRIEKAHRIASTAYLGNHISEQGVPIVQPPGGHAIYLDARAFLPHVPQDQFPGVALAAELYLEGGIRSVEIGTLMFGAAAKMDLVRLAIPRRVYTQSHIDFVVEVILEIWKKRQNIRGLKLLYEAPFLRHFTARLEPTER